MYVLERHREVLSEVYLSSVERQPSSSSEVGAASRPRRPGRIRPRKSRRARERGPPTHSRFCVVRVHTLGGAGGRLRVCLTVFYFRILFRNGVQEMAPKEMGARRRRLTSARRTYNPNPNQRSVRRTGCPSSISTCARSPATARSRRSPSPSTASRTGSRERTPTRRAAGSSL